AAPDLFRPMCCDDFANISVTDRAARFHGRSLCLDRGRSRGSLQGRGSDYRKRMGPWLPWILAETTGKFFGPPPSNPPARQETSSTIWRSLRSSCPAEQPLGHCS